jgi:hypothetical protein
MRRILAIVLLVTAAASSPFLVILGRADTTREESLTEMARLAGHSDMAATRCLFPDIRRR